MKVRRTQELSLSCLVFNYCTNMEKSKKTLYLPEKVGFFVYQMTLLHSLIC